MRRKGQGKTMAKTNVLPNNLEAEQALLGCLLIDVDTQTDVLDKLTEDDFYQESHRLIIGAMKAVFNARKPVDLVTLADELENEKCLDKAGGITYITDLAKITPSAANYKSYLEIVKRDSVNRRLIRASQKIIENAMEGADSADSVAYAEKLVFDISKKMDTSTLVDMREDDSYDRVLNKFEVISTDKNALRGINTGFTKLDKITNGLQKSDFIVLAARPGVGKTTIGMNIIEHAALVDNRVCAVFSLEMPRIQLAQRLLCSYARVSMSKALSGELSQSDWKKLWKASSDLKKAKIYIDDSSKITPAEILSKCRRLKSRKEGLDIIMIDYIQLMGSGERRSEENRQQEIATITRNLKIMAKELDVPVLALSQLRRISSKEEPQLSDLRESGAIEQDADMVMFIHRPDVAATPEEIKSGKIIKDAADLIIAKHRNGELGRVKLRFRGDQVRYVNPPPGFLPDEPGEGELRETEENDEEDRYDASYDDDSQNGYGDPYDDALAASPARPAMKRLPTKRRISDAYGNIAARERLARACKRVAFGRRVGCVSDRNGLRSRRGRPFRRGSGEHIPCKRATFR